ncbi:Flp family type IVb pilin [Kaistia algarum]|uniref:Flp family type IVb pilin n=1 Tax=Kaistia algarum TaxID=2083279 RepID=UPI000CE8D4B0|nr:Flp family type IVb pilin [Kaistia algarum]MCX5516657.1 Flp family type IVb pilin [Kaistia algarum]PPE78560.1 Flp family type IVb pilin [Kaistia algarum]
MKSFVTRFVNNESGATAIEYGLLAALVGCGIIVAATTLATDISTLFTNIGTKLSGTAV